jgi:anti-anti-sigma factor
MDVPRGIDAFTLTERICQAKRREVVAEGELDRAAIPRLREMLEATAGSDLARITLDLERCEFIDAAVVATIAQAQKLLANNSQELVVSGAHGQVRRLLRMTANLGRD